MSAAPLTASAPLVTQAPVCDVPGCGNLADFSTDGSETDSNSTTKDRGRKSVPYVNLDRRHENWSFSEDAQRFAATPDYQQRLRSITAAAAANAGASSSTAPSGKAK